MNTEDRYAAVRALAMRPKDTIFALALEAAELSGVDLSERPSAEQFDAWADAVGEVLRTLDLHHYEIRYRIGGFGEPAEWGEWLPCPKDVYRSATMLRASNILQTRIVAGA
jgi:hypothetical protein